MEYVIKHRPVFSVLEVHMNEAETVVAQPNSMLSMTSGIQLRATAGRSGSSAGGGWLGGVKSLLGGENFFTAEFRAKRDGQVSRWHLILMAISSPYNLRVQVVFS